MVATRTGLSPHVLRAWERRYQVVVPTRSDGGQRLYSDLDIERLRKLRRLVEAGHAISRLARLTPEQLDQVNQGEPQSAGPGPETDAAGARVEEALGAATRFDAARFEAVLERAALTFGIPVFLDQIAAPAMERIGHGWADGSVSVGQEHMATAEFRRVLGWLLRANEVSGPAPRIVVATPPRQVHELGALMVAVSAAAEGWKVTYLGPDMPVAELVRAADETGADAVALSVVYPDGIEGLFAALRRRGQGLPPETPLILGGAAMRHRRQEAESVGALVVETLPEFRSLLARLSQGRPA
ncbi:MAG TPA: MerR family transcriptional regulator [Gemmatimonadales bacterium]|nr:MerR family transcriptional regulator [Gemmatimonadales bacterium]